MRPPGAPRYRVLVAGLVLASGCAPASSLTCNAQPGRPLPRDLLETSGAAWSARHRGVYWTHNDGGDGVLYAVDTTGAVVARVETRGSRLRDVEDLGAGMCGSDPCLYLADTGDNQERRDEVSIHRLREPLLDDISADREEFPIRFPGGPRDVEAMVVLPGERIYLISKGRREGSTVYRYPGPLTPDSVVLLERVAALDPSPPSFTARLSGASAIPGREDIFVIRSYERLMLVELGPDGASRLPGGALNLGPLQEAQGEAVAVRDDGVVVLTSEAGPLSPVPGMHLLRCAFPLPGAGAP